MKKFNHINGQTISVGDAELYVEEMGPSNGVPLLFLHGGFGTIQDFNSIVDKISDDFRCIGIDSRGHGKSTLGTLPLTYAQMEKDVSTVLKALGIMQCMTIGFSDGGIIAYRLAMNNPSLITKVITIGSDWEPPSQILKNIFSKLTVESWQKKFPETVELYNRLNPDPNFGNLLKNVLTMWVDESETGYPGSELNKLQCETLIIRGDNDLMMPRSAISHLHEVLPSAKLLNIPFAGHAAHNDQPDIVGMMINQFIK